MVWHIQTQPLAAKGGVSWSKGQDKENQRPMCRPDQIEEVAVCVCDKLQFLMDLKSSQTQKRAGELEGGVHC